MSSTTTIEAQYAYDPFGQVTKINGSSAADFLFTSYYFQARASLSLSEYRGYSSTLARFISRDIIQETSGANLFQYVNSDPINQIDPDGRMAVVVAPVIIIVAGGAVAIYIGGKWIQEHGHEIGPAFTDLWDAMGRSMGPRFGPRTGTGEGTPLSPKCKKVEEKCIDDCGKELPTHCPQGWPFRRCVDECKARAGCPSLGGDWYKTGFWNRTFTRWIPNGRR